MLAKTLSYKGGGGGGGHHAGPRVGGSDHNVQGSAMMDIPRQGQPSSGHIDRMNPTCTRTRAHLGQYHGGGHECHFRKAPIFGKAYNHPEMDVWAPMQMTEPIRHVDRPFPGGQFGAGHQCFVTKYGSPVRKLITTTWFMQLGTIVGFGTYFRRMWLNGWEVRNQGAVDGFE